MKNVTKKGKSFGEEATEALYGKPKKPKVTMISYSIKMVIPTGNYANIQPEIVVNAGTPEEAEAYIAPHMNKLWKRYYMCGDRGPEMPPHEVKAPINNVPPPPVTEVKKQEDIATSPAMQNALNAINSCSNIAAIDEITARIKKSVKLTDEEKDKCMVLTIERLKKLNGDPRTK